MLPGPLELSEGLSESASAFSDAPERTCSCGGAFRILWHLSYRRVKVWSNWALCAGQRENSGAAETSGQLCGRLGAVFSQQWFLEFLNHKAFHLSDSSLLQLQDSLSSIYGMYCQSKYLDIPTYGQSGCRLYWSIIRGVSDDAECENSVIHLEAVIVWPGRFPWRPWWSEFGDVLGGRDQVEQKDLLAGRDRVNSEMHLKTILKLVWRYTWRWWACQLGGHDRATLEMHLQKELQLKWGKHLQGVIEQV